MSIVALHFASGGAFFSGAAFLVTGMLVATFARRRILPAVGRLFIMAGLLLIALSATPLPMWAWCVWGATFVFWMAARVARGKIEKVDGLTEGIPLGQIHPTPPAPPYEGGERRWRSRSGLSVIALLGVIAVTFAAVLWELSWQVPPRGMHVRRNRLVVIGDSLSAEDFTEGGAPWPTLLAREHGIEVENLAFSGAKAGSAAKRVTSGDFAGAVVLLEIGGNDLLGGTTPAEFERDLEELLRKVCGEHSGSNPNAARPPLVSENNESVEEDPGSNRQAARPPLPPLAKGGRALAVMLELPLPPLYNRFGEIQRRLARRYDVVLIPKRYFASVLIGEEATLDGLHLSPAGHKRMAEMVWERVSDFVKAM